MTQQTEREAYKKAQSHYMNNPAFMLGVSGEMRVACNLAFQAGWQARASLGKGEVEALRAIKARIHAERYECTPLTIDDASTDAEKELMCIIDYIEAMVNAALSAKAKPVEVEEIAEVLREVWGIGHVTAERAANTILAKYNVTKKF